MCVSTYATIREGRRCVRREVVHELPFPWNASLSRSHPSTAGQTFPGEPGQRVSRNMVHTQAGDGV